MATTLDDVAVRAAVSRMTVSNTYGRPELVAASTRVRVLAAAAELGYGGPSAVGRTLRRGSTDVLGILANVSIEHVLSDPGAAQFMRGVASGADEAELSIQLVHAPGAKARARVNDTAVDGFIAWSLPRADPAFVAALERRVPIVAIDGPRGVPGVPCVRADNVGGAHLAAQHLLELGIRRFAVIGTLAGEQFADRVTGWRRALEGAGLAWDGVVRLGADRNSRADGGAAAEAFLVAHSTEQRWGILAMTDVLALGALQHLRAKGVEVPNDVAVVGFDDVEEAAAGTPGLTTVHQDLFAMGRECALRVAGRVVGRVRTHPTALVVRASTDPRAALGPDRARA